MLKHLLQDEGWMRAACHGRGLLSPCGRSSWERTVDGRRVAALLGRGLGARGSGD